MLNPGNAPSFTLPGTYTGFPFLSIAAFGNLSYTDTVIYNEERGDK